MPLEQKNGTERSGKEIRLEGYTEEGRKEGRKEGKRERDEVEKYLFH